MRRDSRHVAILRTLAYRRMLCLFCALAFGGLIMVRLLMRNEIPQHLQGRWGSVVILPLALAAMTSYFLCLHFRELLSRARLATAPGVRWPHFCVACWVCPLPVLACCLLVIRPYVYLPNVFAVGVACFSIAALLSRLPSGCGGFGLFGFTASAHFLGGEYFATLFSGAHEDAAAWCAWGVAAVGFWIWRLVAQAESTLGTAPGVFEFGDSPGRQNRDQAENSAPCGWGKRLDRVCGFVGHDFDQRVELRRLGNGSTAPWVLPITLGIVIFGLAFGIRVAQKLAVGIDPRILAMYFAGVPLVVFRFVWERLEVRFAIERELLAPVSRPDLVREIGVGLVRDLFAIWTVVSIAALGVGLILVGFSIVSLAVLVVLLPSPGVSLCSLFTALAFGARGLVKGFFAGFGCSIGAFGALAMFCLQDESPSSALSLLLSGSVSVLLLLASIPIARWAHRRWCEVELGARSSFG